MPENPNQDIPGSKFKTCPYRCEKCREINMSRPEQSHCSSGTLCWCCKHAVPDRDGKRGCEWSVYSQEVPGWEVSENTEYIMANGSKSVAYNVIRCPKFERG